MQRSPAELKVDGACVFHSTTAHIDASFAFEFEWMQRRSERARQSFGVEGCCFLVLSCIYEMKRKEGIAAFGYANSNRGS
jgi:hypothetical protein